MHVSKKIHTATKFFNYPTNVTYQLQSPTPTKIHELLNSLQVLNDLVGFKLGQVEVYTIPGNYCQVIYLITLSIPHFIHPMNKYLDSYYFEN